MANSPQTFEKRLERVREIVALLEAGDVPLEEGVRLFQKGVRLSGEYALELKQARIIRRQIGRASCRERV